MSRTTKLVSGPGEVLTCVLLHLTEICSGPALSVDGLQKLEGAWGPSRRKLCGQVWVVRRRSSGVVPLGALTPEQLREREAGDLPKARPPKLLRDRPAAVCLACFLLYHGAGL